VFVIGLLYSFKTISRSKYWKDDITIFSHDVKTSPNSATAHYILGSSLAKTVLNSPDKKNQADTFNIAKAHLKRAIEISPDYRTASSYLGFLYLTENNNDSAYYYLKGGIEKAPDDPELNYYFGTALFNLQKYDEALKVLVHAVTLNPKNEDAYFKLAALYMMKGDADNGLLCYSKIIELNPNNAYAWYFAGQILQSKGDTVKANEYINKAASLGYSPK
jgi:tetratricopeptide (TPR) repeat protein